MIAIHYNLAVILTDIISHSYDNLPHSEVVATMREHHDISKTRADLSKPSKMSVIISRYTGKVFGPVAATKAHHITDESGGRSVNCEEC